MRRPACHASTSTEPRSPVVIEAELGDDRPVQCLERLNHMIDDCCVSAIKEPVALPAVPRGADHNRYIEFERDATERLEPDDVQPPALQLGHNALAHAGVCRDVRLTKSSALADGTEDPTDPSVIHRSMMVRAARPTLTRRLTAALLDAASAACRRVWWQLSAPCDHRSMSRLAALGRRVLDLALPRPLPGLRRRGPPTCPACLPALDARLELPAGIAIGAAVRCAAATPATRMVRAVHRADQGRPARAEIRRREAARGPARGRDRTALAHRGCRRRPASSRCRSTRIGRARAATTRRS